MQKLEMIKNPGNTTKANKINKKSKVNGSSKNTAKINSQFAEIFGQLSIALPPAKAAVPKQTEAQTETLVNTVKSAKASAESVGKTNQRSESTPGTSEVAITGKISNKPFNMPAKASGSENSKELTARAQTKQVNGSKTEINSNASITGSKISGTEKSVVTSTVGAMLNMVTSTNMGNSAKSEPREIADIMGSQVSSIAKSSKAGTNEETHGTAASNITKAGVPSEIKIADLMLASNISQAENTAIRSADKKLPGPQEVSKSSVSAVSSGNSIVISSKESTKSNHDEAGSDSERAKTSATKTEMAANSLLGEKGVVEFEVPGFGGANAETSMLSKSQTDFLVNKMIQQIKVAPSSLEVSLKPEYLGKINILVHSIAGVISINVIAQNSEALNLVNSNLQNIKDNLQQQGIDVQQLEVNLSNQEKQNNPSGNNFKGESPAAKPVEKANTLTEYDNLVDAEQSTSLSYKLNLLA